MTRIKRTPATRQGRCQVFSGNRFSVATRHLFDAAFIGVLVRRLHAAHEALHHPRRIL